MAILFNSTFYWLQNACIQKLETKKTFNPTISKTTNFFKTKPSTSMVTKGLVNPTPWGNHCKYLFVDDFGIYIVTVPFSKKTPTTLLFQDAHTEYQKLILLNIWLQGDELKILILRWQIPIRCLFSDPLPELHTLHGQIDLLKYKLRSLEPVCERLYMIRLKTALLKNILLHIPTKLNLCHTRSSYEIVSHTQPRRPLSFQLNLYGNKKRECTAQNCSDLPCHSH